MSDSADILRGPGRTTRMLKAAIEADASGKCVVVVCADYAHTFDLRRKAVTSSGRDSIDFLPRQRLGCLRGGSRETVVLWDHYAVETHASELRARIHQLNQERGKLECELAETEVARTE